MTNVLLALNAGSSSIKFSLFTITHENACHPERSEGSGSTDAQILRCAQDDNEKETLSLLSRGEVESLGSKPHFHIYNATGQQLVDEQLATKAVMSHEEALSMLLGWIEHHEA